MRNRFLMSGATMAVTVLIAGALATSVVDDVYDQRLDDLETRVARLEEAVGLGTPSSTQAGTGGEEGDVSVSTDSTSVNVSSSNTSSSSSSTSSSVQSGSGSFSGSYSSSGDSVIELELSNGGAYRLTAQPASALSLRLQTEGGEEVPAFTVDVAGGETRTVEGALEPGNYALHAQSDAQWMVNITLVGE